MAMPALKLVSEKPDRPSLREQLATLAQGRDPYLIRMWREALLEEEGTPRGPDSDSLAFPYVPFLPEQFGLGLTESSRVLDLGCLAGFGLFDFARRRARHDRPVPTMVGIDVDRESLALGAALAPAWTRPGQVAFHRATGEVLPCATGSFDLVIARSVLQYLKIQPALRELARVVRPGGLVLVQIHGLGYYLHQIARHLRRPLQAGYYGRALISGLIFSASCRQPEHRWFKEAAMTYGCLLDLCAALGLEPVWSNRDARRPLVLFVKT
jgi:SAM-dependent methyltransferase